MIELECFSVVLRVMYRVNFGARRKAGEFERLPVCARNSSGTLNVHSFRSMRSCASISSAVAEKRRVLGGYRCGRSAMSRQTFASHSGPTGARIRLKIVAPLGIDRPHRPTKSEVNRPCRFNLASKKRSSTPRCSFDRFNLRIF